jgi:hypothetical protein
VLNYFNYFTEIEEHFQQARNSGMFLVSPLDWAIIETWKEAGVPLEAVLKGIDRAFEKWHAKKTKTRMVNSLAYCAQEVLTAAREMQHPAEAEKARQGEVPFRSEELVDSFRRHAALLRQAAGGAAGASQATYAQVADSLEQLATSAAAGGLSDLESLEQRLTVLEDKMIAAAMQAAPEQELVEARAGMQRQLAPYRRKMSAEQLAMLEKQYLQRCILDAAGLPRLSLFYL